MAITLSGTNQKILVHDEPIASGGEGAVHRIITPAWYRDRYCAKLYLKQHRTPQRKRKVQFMVEHPPAGLDGNSTRIVCWPTEVLHEANGRLAGFVMPLAFGGSRLLYELCTPQMKTLPPIWTNKYERTTADGVRARLKLCVNIAAAINEVHLTREYVLVDLKPQNLLVTSDGKVSVIDMDSVQISNGNKILFAAQFATPEYVPAEGNVINPSRDLIAPSWDNFSLAVIFYQLLFGLHPYAASFNSMYKDSTTVADSIKNGLFVFGSKRNYVHVRPELHDNFRCIPPSLQQLFLKAFDGGHAQPSLRPTPGQWGEVTFTELTKPTPQWQSMKRPKPKILGRKSNVTQRRATATSTHAATVPAHTIPRTKTQATPASKSETPAPLKALVGLVIAAVLLVLVVNLCSQLGKKTARPAPTISTQVAYVNSINLNLRSGPGVRYSVLKVLPQGTQVLVFDDRRYADHATWVRVKVGSQEGWVNQEHLR